jgi:3',5'-cyclic AMP phosphodiesterase CpdA
MATGAVGERQAAALGNLLGELGRTGLIRVLLIHHPPVAGLTHWHRRLTDARRIRNAIASNGAELVLHGHNHRFSVASIAGPNGPVPVVGAAAASLRPRTGRAGGSYNLLRIEGTRIDLTQRRFAGPGSVETVCEQRLAG